MRSGLRLALVGAGLVGQRHAKLMAEEAILDAVIDPNPAARAVAEAHASRWFADLEAYIADTRPDGAIVATPNQLHAVQGKLLLEAGVPVLVEKPIADTSEAGADLVATSDRTGVPLAIGHHRRHNPVVVAAKHAITDGRLGKVVTISAQFWLYKPDSYFAEAWRTRPGAGPVLINLIHDVDLMRNFGGEVRRVHAVLSNRMRGHEVEDSAAVILEFRSGALGTVSGSDTVTAPWSWEFTSRENPAYPEADAHCYMIGGTHGSLSVPDLRLWHHPGRRGWWEPITAETLPIDRADPLVLQLRQFLDVIANGAAPLVSGHEALATLRVIEAIGRAARTGEAVGLEAGEVGEPA